MFFVPAVCNFRRCLCSSCSRPRHSCRESEGWGAPALQRTQQQQRQQSRRRQQQPAAPRGHLTSWRQRRRLQQQLEGWSAARLARRRAQQATQRRRRWRLPKLRRSRMLLRRQRRLRLGRQAWAASAAWLGWRRWRLPSSRQRWWVLLQLQQRPATAACVLKTFVRRANMPVVACVCLFVVRHRVRDGREAAVQVKELSHVPLTAATFRATHPTGNHASHCSRADIPGAVARAAAGPHPAATGSAPRPSSSPRRPQPAPASWQRCRSRRRGSGSGCCGGWQRRPADCRAAGGGAERSRGSRRCAWAAVSGGGSGCCCCGGCACVCSSSC